MTIIEPTRRQFLQVTGGLGALLAVHALPLLLRPVTTATAPYGLAVSPQAVAKVSSSTELHLIKRLTFGITPDLLAHVEAIGTDAFIEEQLAPDTLDDAEMDAILSESRIGVNMVKGAFPV